MLILGILVLLVALLALAFYLKTSYETHGGAIGQVPVYGASVVQIPLLIMLGLNLINDASVKFHFPWYYYLLVWFALVIFIGSLISLVGRLSNSKST